MQLAAAISLQENVLGRKENGQGGPSALCSTSGPCRGAVLPLGDEAGTPHPAGSPRRAEGCGEKEGDRPRRRAKPRAYRLGRARRPPRAGSGRRRWRGRRCRRSGSGRPGCSSSRRCQPGRLGRERQARLSGGRGPVPTRLRASRSRGGKSLLARRPPAPRTLVAEDAGPARRAVAAGLLRVARASVLAVLAGQAAVGAERVLQADCKERRRGSKGLPHGCPPSSRRVWAGKPPGVGCSKATCICVATQVLRT